VIPSVISWRCGGASKLVTQPGWSIWLTRLGSVNARQEPKLCLLFHKPSRFETFDNPVDTFPYASPSRVPDRERAQRAIVGVSGSTKAVEA
jgi:hypothetical protein